MPRAFEPDSRQDVPVRVLHVFGVLNRGGAESRTLAIQNQLLKRNIHFDYVLLSGNEGVLDDTARSMGSRLYHLKLNLQFPYQFFRLLKTGKVEIVHTHVALSSALILLIAFCARVPIRISHFRSADNRPVRSFARRCRNWIFKEMVGRFATTIVGVCEGALDSIWKDGSWKNIDKYQVIYNGFELSQPVLSPTFWQDTFNANVSKPVVLNVARMDEPKNHARIASIFKSFYQNNPTSTLIFIGRENPEIKATIEGILKTEILEAKVHFLGESDRALEAMAHADVFLFPSKWEGLPGVVIESLSQNTPVLSTDLPGAHEIAYHLDGLALMSLSQSDECWATALEDILMDIDTKHSSQIDGSVFSMNSCVQSYLKLYNYG